MNAKAMKRKGSSRERVPASHNDLGKILKGLRREIYSGLRLPRERLLENDLSESYSVSRMVVRQALSTLASEGLVNLEPYKGASVAEISLVWIYENYQVFAMLQGFAARLAVDNLTKDDHKALSVNLQKQRALQIDKVQDYQSLNHQFHRIINLKSGNQRLVELIRQNSQFTSYWFIVLSAPGRISTNIAEHQEILEAIKHAQPEEVRQRTENHILNSGKYLVDFLRNNIPIGMWRNER